MSFKGKKLGILVSVAPSHPNFHHAIHTADAALAMGATVYLYCIDEAVRGVDEMVLQQLRPQGLILYACAYGAQQRGLPLSDRATFAGLTIVNDLIAGTDRFVSFN
jgi:predicted peroxiredoxin